MDKWRTEEKRDKQRKLGKNQWTTRENKRRRKLGKNQGKTSEKLGKN